MKENLKMLTLGGGCFWCIEAVFSQVRGVLSAVSGYSGGNVSMPTYLEVCSGNTGHAEVVRLEYDSDQVSLEILLEIFFAVHDPTTPNRQGNDIGTQYRSIIFYHSPDQLEVIRDSIARMAAANKYSAPIVTEFLPAVPFYPGEEYHQQYFAQNSGQGYCQVVIAPKLAKLRKNFSKVVVSPLSDRLR